MYYGELTEIFCELDHRDKVIMESENDVESYRKLVQRQMVHIFLTGLDGEFEQIDGEILRKYPIPNWKHLMLWSAMNMFDSQRLIENQKNLKLHPW